MPPLASSKAVLILESQPPHAGEMLQIIQALQHYDFLYLCINPTPIVLPFSSVLAIWNSFLQPYVGKVQIATLAANMAEISKKELPALFEGSVYLTIDKVIFVHLNSIGVAAQLVPQALGYHGIFVRGAYRQSRALNWLETKFVK